MRDSGGGPNLSPRGFVLGLTMLGIGGGVTSLTKRGGDAALGVGGGAGAVVASIGAAQGSTQLEARTQGRPWAARYFLSLGTNSRAVLTLITVEAADAEESSRRHRFSALLRLR